MSRYFLLAAFTWLELGACYRGRSEYSIPWYATNGSVVSQSQFRQHHYKIHIISQTPPLCVFPGSNRAFSLAYTFFRVVPRVVRTKPGQNVHMRCPSSGNASRLKLRDDPQLSRVGGMAGMLEHAAGNSEQHCGLVRAQDLSPRRARHRPSTDCVGVLAGVRPAHGPNGFNPSAPSWRCSAGRSRWSRRRPRCCCCHSLAPLIHSAA